MTTTPLADGPPPTDYAVIDPRPGPHLAADKKIAELQGATLGKHSPELLERVLGDIRRARSLRKDLTQFDAMRENSLITSLVVVGELIVRVADSSAALRDELRAAEFTSAAVPEELDGHVERHVNSGISTEELSGLARRLREAGHRVSVNHITPLGYWVKNEEGPEHSTWRQAAFPRPEVPGPVVAVIDTGILRQEDRTDGWLDEVVREPGPDGNVDELDGPDQGLELDLGAGHGTFTCGIVRQVAPNATIRAYKAMDAAGIGSEVAVAAAMVRAVREGARILNLSLGTKTLDDQEPVAIEAALDLIDDYNGEHGPGSEVLVVAAAGNFGDAVRCWPAAFPRVVAVASITTVEEPTGSDWSSHGDWVDCATVGEGVSSPYVPGVESILVDSTPDTFAVNDWALWGGTSFAAPQIAGLAARVCSSAAMTPRQACAAILAGRPTVPNYGRAVRILPGT